ncbi:MAG TPA: DUF6184 family natural product biosynthesis lipoprotein [Polyangia bacterium]|jgi:hypothetical protein|nr:DUF6184 family natural product biosynthesis lipoprotein [Polyangia bacterium]
MRTFQLMMLAVVASLAALGCGSDAPSTQAGARDAAAAAACNYYARCMMIGSGKTFASTDACLTQVKNTFQTLWPPEACMTISSTGINNCLTSINIAECGNGSDAANVLLNKCTRANVCAATN